jgi:nicotinate-nucleotide pyrophosphorylase (carboxylating)
MSPPQPLDPTAYRDIVARALAEDIGDGDLTTAAVVPPDARARGVFIAKSECVLAGLDVALEAFRALDPDVRVAPHRDEGERCHPGDEMAEVSGAARTLLSAERTALNFLQRLCGIATLARAFSDAAGGRVTILDTRKTTPTLRALEKYAVRVGGASNHRAGLYDAILIKDNHIRVAGSVTRAVKEAAAYRPDLPIEIETQTLDEVDEALEAGVDVVMVDNFAVEAIREAVRRAKGRARIEISGGVTLERVPELADTGADFISAGALTHSAPAADISFDIDTL